MKIKVECSSQIFNNYSSADQMFPISASHYVNTVLFPTVILDAFSPVIVSRNDSAFVAMENCFDITSQTLMLFPIHLP